MPPKQLPEMEATTPEQEALITQLLEVAVESLPPTSVPPHIAELNAEDRRIAAYKFLIARKWDLQKAAEMWQATIAHKAKYRVDELGHFPPAFPMTSYDPAEVNALLGLPTREPDVNDRYAKVTGSVYKATYHKWDKRGHPLFIERTGRVNVKKIVQLYKGLAPVGTPYPQPCVDFHVHFNEVGARLARYQDRTWGAAKGTRVLGVLAILDCAGLGYGHMYKPALELLKRAFECDASYYPEGLHAVYVVNCPTMITFAYSIVKMWLDPRVQNKITFLKPHQTKEGLLEIIDAENLPDFLGGLDTTCPIASLEDSDAEDACGDETMTEEIRVPAGKCIVKHFPVEAGEEVTWEFSVEAMTIEFGVAFIDGVSLPTPASPAAGSPAMASPASVASYIAASSTQRSAFEGQTVVEVVPKGKVGSGTDSFRATTRGTVVLTWDNHFSWMNSKVVSLRAMRM